MSLLLQQISLCGKLIASKVRAAGLSDVLGYAGSTNVHGDSVQKLDKISDNIILETLGRTGVAAGYASEELDDFVPLNKNGQYLVVVDPLDGSSNIDVNVSIGTIFGILARPVNSVGSAVKKEEFLQPGKQLKCSGYVLYGTSTMLVVATPSRFPEINDVVNGFTWDPAVGEFFLSHENIRCPIVGKTYSINAANENKWSNNIKKWHNNMKDNNSLRYVGSMVADAHRTLLKGGIFVYPEDTKNTNGKLRILYEANPMAQVFECAGGSASTGSKKILNIEPTSLHERTPVVLGSKSMVEDFEIACVF